jgi:iron(III) transport system ATP-binding protein
VLAVRDLVKSFPTSRGERHRRVLAVERISFEVERGELFTLLGPSGCGKTTTLRCIAGLESPDEGEIEVAGRVFFSSKQRIHVSANARGLGMVFQSYAIWPHMDVFHNVAFPLQVLPRRRRPSRRQLREQVERALEVVRLDQFASRRATDLSGGQQQRLALARALVVEPPLLLLDEPLSNLDAKLREEMRFELKRLQRELGITSVYVTHDQAEALALSSRIAVMRHGKIEQIGKPREVYERPASRFVADFIGTSNFLDGTVNAREHGVYTIQTALGELRARSDADLPVGAQVTVSARPEHITLEPGSNGTGPNRWQGRVEARAFLGEFVDHVVSVDRREIRARCNSTVSIPPETAVTLIFSEDTFSLIPTGD